MASMIEKIRRAREREVEVGGFKFTIRRPTEVQMMQWQGGKIPVVEFIQFITGWDRVTEGDLIPGGDPHPLPFSADICKEWLNDRLDLVAPLAEQIMGLWNDYITQKDARSKN